jgi:hypothetical protein
MAWLFITLVVIGLYVAWGVLHLARNYVAARKSGFPILVSPIDPTSGWWLVVSNSGIFSLRLAENAPKWAWRHLRYLSFHASFLDQVRAYDPPEPAVMLVTPGSNLLWIHDPTLGDLVLARRKDFTVHPLTRGK